MNVGIHKSLERTEDKKMKNVAIHFGLLLALAIPTPSFSGDSTSNSALNAPLFVAKDDAKCEICLKKLAASCDKENKICVEKSGVAACKAYYEKCKEGVRARCGGPSLCD